MTGGYTIELDFPIHPRPRYGWGKPAHPKLATLIGEGRDRYVALLREFLDHREALRRIAHHPQEDAAGVPQPAWINGTFPGLDAVSLYGLIARHRPERYYEVGMGSSTLFARQAINDQGLDTELVSIDPYADPATGAVCSRQLREPLEDMNLSLFDQLQAGDMLFVDNSHRVFMNSDVTVFFLDILPRLAPGVIVGLHDIALPWDYPPEWVERYYSEQYMLAVWLLAGGHRSRVLLPNAWISMEEAVVSELAPLWSDPAMNGEFTPPRPEALQTGLIETHGSAFWLEMRPNP